ncbi:MAG: hypothetical protein LBH13_08120 [Cellulomonadaceae bacterium]|jgi:NAD-dependent SIR2 family protein deacetylase|nr:hypothetical protein [Cellulomonadaceae bacterium]
MEPGTTAEEHQGTLKEQYCTECNEPLDHEERIDRFYSLRRQMKCDYCGAKNRVKVPLYVGQPIADAAGQESTATA